MRKDPWTFSWKHFITPKWMLFHNFEVCLFSKQIGCRWSLHRVDFIIFGIWRIFANAHLQRNNLKVKMLPSARISGWLGNRFYKLKSLIFRWGLLLYFSAEAWNVKISIFVYWWCIFQKEGPTLKAYYASQILKYGWRMNGTSHLTLILIERPLPLRSEGPLAPTGQVFWAQIGHT